MKKGWIIGVISVVLIIALIVIFYNKPLENDDNLNSNTEEKVIYESINLGISFEYPSDFEISDFPEYFTISREVYLDNSNYVSLVMFINKINQERATDEQIKEELGKVSLSRKPLVSRENKGDYEFLLFDWDNEGNDKPTYFLLSDKGSFIIYNLGANHKSALDGQESYEYYLRKFREIIYSIQVI
jgi:hypothetical protein